ncbi:hypothetical protein FIBSPDRAFT_966172 [Athelia psychrophila]|uniref:Uncharacterized protein n=1 Tax=Athelia psychrophila TaxID=1759441 RepID=A0A167X338_9AGAM|nr:hypothetical protein FIBSPDRAFT_966172 [Fibularhizoctonia sp. CBS 109695]
MAENFTGNVNKNSLKAFLQCIARALQLDDKGTREDLANRIKPHLEANHEALSQDARFQGLYVYRSGNTIAQTEKNSADKTTEDHVEASKPPQTATGANKKLIDLKTTVDPPAQHGRLGDVIRKIAKPKVTFNTGSQEDDASSSAGGDSDLEDPLKPNEPSSPPRSAINGLDDWENYNSVYNSNIIVNFFDRTNSELAPREIWVAESPVVPVEVTGSGSAADEFSASVSLSQLLPAAIQNDSPMKARGGRLYRKGLNSGSAHVPLGSIDSLVEGRSSALSFARVNQYKLNVNETGEYVCDIFWEGPVASGEMVAEAIPAARTLTSTEPKQMIKSEVVAAGPSTIAAAPTFNSGTRATAIMESLQEAFRKVAGWRRKLNVPATTAGHVLNRFKDVQLAIKTLQDLGWTKSKGGYQFPADHLLLAGVSFVKDDIISALSIGHSAAGTDAKLFSSEVLQKIDAVKEWVGEPDGPAGERYSSMTVASFRKYVDGKLSEPSYGHNHKRKREAPKSKKVNLKGKNKCVEVTPESSEEEGSSSSDVVPTRRIRKRTAMGSEELDE